MTRRVLVGWAVLVLLLMNGLIMQKELILRSGRVVLMPLAPRDPRSLMQGDYMALRYAQPAGLPDPASIPWWGTAVFTLDADGVASFVRLLGPQDILGAGEFRLRFRKDGRSMQFAADSFFFQEGQAAVFQPARYGELRVAPSGDCLLTGLRDAERRPLGDPRTP